MVRPVPLLAFAFAMTLAGCVAPPPSSSYELALASGPQCFRAHEISSLVPGPNGVVNVQTANGRAFEMQLSGSCPDVSWIRQIGVRPWNSLWLCEGQPDHLIAPNPDDLGPCRVSVHQVSPTTLPA